MANALIAYNNRIDDATVAGGSWRSTLPLSNLQNRRLRKFARSLDTALASTQWTVDLGGEKLCRTFAFINHNLSLDAKVRIRAGLDPTFANNLFDTGWVDAWPAVYSTMSLPFDHPGWFTGKFAEEERQGFYWDVIKSAPATIRIRYVKFEIDDTGNTDGYVQTSRCFVGEAHQLEVNMDYGASVGWRDESGVQTSRSGAEFFDVRTPYRVANFTTGFMSKSEGMTVFDIQRRSGIHREVLFQYDPNDLKQSLRLSWCGRLEQLDSIQHPYPATHSTGWGIRESL